MGFLPEKSTEKENYMKSVRKMLPPELVSRIDEILVFEKLGKESIVNIFKSKLADVIEKLKNNGITAKLEFDGDDLFNLNKNTEDHARQIKQIVRQKIEMPLSKFIIHNYR